MENQRNLFFITTLILGGFLYIKWMDFNTRQNQPDLTHVQVQVEESAAQKRVRQEVPQLPTTTDSGVPDLKAQPALSVPGDQTAVKKEGLIHIETDLLIAVINTLGGVIESLELKQQLLDIDNPEQGFPLLKNSPGDIYISQDGLLAVTGDAPNHAATQYQVVQTRYQLNDRDEIIIPLTWQNDSGIEFIKTFRFARNSYQIEIDYQVINRSAERWSGLLYAQFFATEGQTKTSGFGQLPSYHGAAIYTEEEKYEKTDYDDLRSQNLQRLTRNGWVAMLQHYFVGVWLADPTREKEFYSGVNQSQSPTTYRVGYKEKQLTHIDAGESGHLKTAVFLGPKEQSRLKAIEENKGIEGLALTVDYGWLTFLADPLFIALGWIHSLVGNWGWAIILLTILIKIVFYPLSAASYKSMAGMKKLQPRMQTLKERYQDDKQKFQMEMMALYKKEKINPAGGCLPILIQIPVFIALYWVLLESVELRQAPFALWLQDLSAPDPFYILPVLMGASMWVQQKLNPAPMEDIQKKVMMIMPVALTLLFLTFPQGLVLYWVVNNVLSIAQQWLINKQYAT